MFYIGARHDGHETRLRGHDINRRQQGWRGTWAPALHNCVICLLDGHITLATGPGHTAPAPHTSYFVTQSW